RDAGAEVEVEALDIVDEGAVRRIVGARRLDTVFHLAGTRNDGLLTNLSEEQLRAVVAPKLDGARNLDHALAEQPEARLVLFSSLAGWMGGAGQASYAAANTALDALAEHRRARGLPTSCLAWGVFDPADGGMTGDLGPSDLARLRRAGVRPMSMVDGMALLDAALARPEACLVLARLDLEALRVLRPPRPRQAVTRAPVAEAGEVLTIVREIVARLRSEPVSAIDPDAVLVNEGLDSLMAISLRNELSEHFGRSLPSTLAYDYPSPRAIAAMLSAQSRVSVTASAPRSLDEPIAIIGMACRLPQGIEHPDALWEVFAEGRDLIGPFPDRWDVDALYDPDPDARGKCVAKEGGFLRDLAGFDASFFGISPREAEQMDPQQRLVLETTWEALEHAGVRADALQGTTTGVYVGAFQSSYPTPALEGMDGYGGTGTATSVISGRVAYTLGLYGPAITVDTACSSSLVALHLACSALRAGECELALAGGVQVLVTPATFVEFSRLRGLAPDGRCKAFSAQADGAGWAEGCGFVVLKPLAAARRDGDRVLAVVRGTASNQDGRSQGMTAPNGPSQQRAITQAIARSGLTPGDIDYVEAHGTGTRLGDPIEAGALAAVFGPDRTRPLHLGSSKSNVGHTQAAAGIVGVMKVVLSLQHQRLPRSLHTEEPSPLIDWEGGHLHLLQESVPWEQEPGRVRRAGVSSFGISGTNAHVILEQAPDQSSQGEPDDPSPTIPLLLSARDRAALQALAARWCTWLDAHPDVPWEDVVYTAARRSQHPHRAVAHGIDGLRALAAGREHEELTTARARTRGGLVMVFPGQGSQWEGMGRALLEQSPVFAAAIAECEEALAPWMDVSITAGLRGELPLDRVDRVQPALFAMAIALARLWQSLGIEPAAVIGHSQGEIAAAVVAGALSLTDGAAVVAIRSRLLSRLAGSGAMLAVDHPRERVEAALAASEDPPSIAVINTSESVVLAGTTASIEAVSRVLEGEGAFCRRVDVDYASHGPGVEPILAELADALAELRPRPPTRPLLSTVTDEPASFDAAYWCRNLRSPVRFDRAVRRALDLGHDVFLEVSPHPVLAVPLAELLAERDGLVVASLQRDDGTLARLHARLAELHIEGYPVSWLERASGHLVSLPTYAWQRERYWVDEPPPPRAGHPLLGPGHATSLLPGARLWPIELSSDRLPWLDDHRVFGTPLLPGSGLVELVLAAATELSPETPCCIEAMSFVRPISLQTPWRGELVAQPAEAGAWSLRLVRQSERGWDEYATATVRVAQREERPTRPLAAIEQRCDRALDRAALTAAQVERGLEIGPAFASLVEGTRAEDELLARLVEPVDARGQRFAAHPAVLDAALGLWAALRPPQGDGLSLLARLGRVRSFAPTARAGWAYVREEALELLDDDGRVCLRAEAAQFQPIEAPARDPWLAVAWVDAPPAAVVPQTWILLDEHPERFAGLSAAFSARGARLQTRSVDPQDSEAIAVALAEPHDGVLALGGSARLEVVADDLALLLGIIQSRAASRLCVVTRGAQAVDGPPSNPADAALWGLLRSLDIEHPELACLRVDLDPTRPEGEDDALADVILSTSAAEEVALRSGRVKVGRVTRHALAPSSAPPPIHADATYLVVGGLGGLGLLTARWLVEAGARHLVLTSRHGRTSQADALDELRAMGAELKVAAVDVTDADALAALLGALPPEHPLRGVFHVAGVLADGLLLNLGIEHFREVFAPKIQGTLNLHRLTAEHPLDHFVLYASASALLGAPGMANYAAANAWLGAFAHHRRAEGRPALAIDWGLFAGFGMGLKAEREGQATARGMGSFSAQQGQQIFERLLTLERAGIAPVLLDVERWVEATPQVAEQPRFCPLLAEVHGRRVLLDLGDALRARPAAEQLPWMQAFVREQAAGVLRLPVDRLDPRRPLQELGLDSVMGLELRNRLRAALGQPLPATLVWTWTTVAQLAEHLLLRWREAQEPAAQEPAAQEPTAEDPLLAAFDAELAAADELVHS
ncbi:MAG: SDR family NAD(P)-dependent oxidoreductase, partial [Myxococcales bacterium]|nr:SDR family NAD(P)-dependent oxidoreductase [Myxococcales bacterium]